MSQNTQSMFGGSQTTPTARKKYTGLASFDVIMLNPSKEEIEAAIGREYKLPVDYSAREIQGKLRRPIEFWVSETSGLVEPLSVRFLIGREADVNQNGKTRFINVVGDFAQADSAEVMLANEKMGWFTKHSFRPAIVGEYELFTFMQRLMRYNSRSEGANFIADTEKLGITAERLFEGDLTGLRSFMNWANENQNHITMPLAVRKQEKVAADGKVNVFYNQAVVANPSYMYQNSDGKVSKRSIDALNGEIDKGRRITTMLFTVEFMEFDEEKCINPIPDAVATSATPVTGNLQNWLNG